MGATLLKDVGYREEREVRIVAIPGTEKLMALGLRANPGRFTKQRLPVVERKEKRYVTFFRDTAVKLPVKRIIVGPAEGADERAALARKMRPDVPVIVFEVCTATLTLCVAKGTFRQMTMSASMAAMKGQSRQCGTCATRRS